jgi:mRNA interferase MazF
VARRGEVWDYTQPGQPGRYRVVVVSADAHNDTPGAWPVCVLLTHRTPPGGEIRTAAVGLADVDPVGGVAVVPSIRQLDPHGFTASVGMLTGATLARIEAALRALLDL